MLNREDCTCPIVCNDCGQEVSNTDDTDLEMNLMLKHLQECKKKSSDQLHIQYAKN
jgi:hypothetical protein